jgi:hypothetical protein
LRFGLSPWYPTAPQQRRNGTKQLRLSMPYLDPRICDGGAYESARYAERGDDIGRLMIAKARGEPASKESVRR